MQISLHPACAIRRLPLLLVALLPACQGGPDPTTVPARDADSVAGAAQGAPIEILSSPELNEIATLEDRRSLGEGRLVELLGHRQVAVRIRAATALGRFSFPDFGGAVTNPLCRVLEDEEAGVRAAAAFALGQRADPASAGVLLAYRNDPDPLVRARVVEASSRVDDPILHRELLVALRDSDLGVRIEAAVGTARWSPEADGADDVDRALLDALNPYTLAAEPRREAGTETEPELRWRLLYALARRRSEAGRGAFLEHTDAENPLERLFAIRGLACIQPRPEVVAALSRVLREEVVKRKDWRVAYEAAVGLGTAADAGGLDALLEAVEHQSPHVRSAALDALGSFPGERSKVLPKLQRGLLDLSTSASAAALRSIVRVLPVDDVLEPLNERAGDSDAIVRMGAAEAAALVEDGRIVPLLLRLADDPSPLVATRAIDALAGHLDPQIRGVLHAYLAHEDNGRRLAAVGALKTAPDPADVEALAAALRGSTGDIAPEIAFNVLDTLAEIGGEEARAVHEEASGDPRPHVRRVARRNLTRAFGVTLPEAAPAPLEPPEPPPLPDRDYRRWRRNPMVELQTNLGAMVFELFPAEAPIHVHSFLELARKGHYDGLVFHRVVPDFVIQGGDYRGDGNGAAPWRGEALRQEFTPRKYVRGSLGMPRNEDPDSGGSQFFVTHRPTPHLDGQYTIFGEIRAGGEVLDRIQVGDHILGIRVLR